jgi:Protein of unknown function, DUF600
MADPTEVYKRIAHILERAIPEPWDTATMRVEVGEKRTDHVTTYRAANGKTGQVFIEDEIDPLVRELQKEMAKTWSGRKWYTFDFNFQSSGKFSVDFGYDKTPWMLEAEKLGKAQH